MMEVSIIFYGRMTSGKTVGECGSIFGPAEIGEGLGDAGQGEADYVEVIAFDAGDVAAGASLDGVGAGFVVRLAGGEVTRDFFDG